MGYTPTAQTIETEVSKIERVVLSETGYMLKPLENRQEEINDYMKVLESVKDKLTSETLRQQVFTSMVINYKKKRNLVIPNNLTKKEKESLMKDISIFVAKQYSKSEIEPKLKMLIAELDRDMPKIVSLKKVESLTYATITNNEVDVSFVNQYRYELKKISEKVLGKPKSAGTLKNSSVAKDKAEEVADLIFKRIVRLQVTELENYGFKVVEKRDLLSKLRKTELMPMVNNIKSQNDLTKDIIDGMNKIILDNVNAVVINFSNEERKIILDTINKVHEQKFNEYAMNLPVKDVVAEVFKLSKKTNEFNKAKTKYSYKDLKQFNQNIENACNKLVTALFEKYKPLVDKNETNYKDVVKEVKYLIENACKFTDADTLAYNKIKQITKQFEGLPHIDNVNFIDEKKTVEIHYDSGKGLIIINPYVIAEAYTKRIFADKTKSLNFGDTSKVRSTKTTMQIVAVLEDRLRSIYTTKSEFDLIVKPFDNVQDYKRVENLHKTLLSQPKYLTDLNIQVKKDKDVTNKENRVTVKIGNRILYLSPEFIFDVNTQRILYKRENKGSTVSSIEDSNFKAENLKGINPNAIAFIKEAIKHAFDLRRNLESK